MSHACADGEIESSKYPFPETSSLEINMEKTVQFCTEKLSSVVPQKVLSEHLKDPSKAKVESRKIYRRMLRDIFLSTGKDAGLNERFAERSKACVAILLRYVEDGIPKAKQIQGLEGRKGRVVFGNSITSEKACGINVARDANITWIISTIDHEGPLKYSPYDDFIRVRDEYYLHRVRDDILKNLNEQMEKCELNSDPKMLLQFYGAPSYLLGATPAVQPFEEWLKSNKGTIFAKAIEEFRKNPETKVSKLLPKLCGAEVTPFSFPPFDKDDASREEAAKVSNIIERMALGTAQFEMSREFQRQSVLLIHKCKELDPTSILEEMHLSLCCGFDKPYTREERDIHPQYRYLLPQLVLEALDRKAAEIQSLIVESRGEEMEDNFEQFGKQEKDILLHSPIAHTFIKELLVKSSDADTRVEPKQMIKELRRRADRCYRDPQNGVPEGAAATFRCGLLSYLGKHRYFPTSEETERLNGRLQQCKKEKRALQCLISAVCKLNGSN